ncbi:MAG: bifunctional UDP-N-acetylglucosamine diphosphorylase/glucosamine-1-phosphate N-acetyltransferase GlmU [Alphaproteobacteria bacterium]|nr:bifunctional UDP-N-acetylglucosamine diphosphorylase/glucosamine-1-phosphate N-acetyltransferase GlmU [Alphaproteobacteria bacterium]
MTQTKTHIIILAAGQGSRMKSMLPKVLHKVGNLPMIAHVIKTALKINPASISVVLSNASAEIEKECKMHAPDIHFFYQNPPLGTAHAVLAAAPILENTSDTIIVLYGDTPLISLETLQNLERSLQEHDLVVVGMETEDKRRYGRIILKEDRTIDAIIETHNSDDASLAKAQQSNICNAGLMAFRAAKILEGLRQIPLINGEYPLTHIIPYCRSHTLSVGLLLADERECHGVNARSELAAAEANFQSLMREKMMNSGVTLKDPSTVYFSYDTALEVDCVIEPNVHFGPGVHLASEVIVRSFCYLEGCEVAKAALIGPFARIRPDSIIGPNARIGNFVEVKNSTLQAGAKVNHLSYIGDAQVGSKTNIGAGTITCNYDGYSKLKTIIKDNVFIGANTALVAPLVIESGAIIAAGSTITKNVEKDALAAGRAPQKEIIGAALKYHLNKKKED